MNRTAVSFLAVLVAVCGVYGGILATSWHFDDDKAVREHLAVLNEDWGGVRGLFFGRGAVTASYVLCKKIADGDSPVVYHAVDLALHAGCAVALLALLRGWFAATGRALSPFWAAAGVFFWAVHPASSQGVVYIAQRGERMCLLFYLLGLWFLLKGLLGWRGGRHASAWLAAAVLAWGLSLGSKENAVTLPVAALFLLVSLSRGGAAVFAGVPFRWAAAAIAFHAALCLVLFGVPPTGGLALAASGGLLGLSSVLRARQAGADAAGEGRRRFIAAAAWIALFQVLTHLNVRGQLSRNQDVLAAPQGERSFAGDAARREERGILAAVGDAVWRNEYFLTQARAVGRYVSLQAFPRHLNVDYDWTPVRSLSGAPDVALLWLLWGGGLAAAAVALARNGSPYAFGALWFGAALAPTSSLFRLSDLVFEHRLYLPAAGLAWVAAAGGVRASRASPRGGRALAVAALLFLGVFSVRRVRDWTDDLTLYADSVRKAPRGFRQRTNLGLGHEERRDFRRAEREHLLSIRMFDGVLWVEPFGNLGNVYLQTGQLDKARRCYETVLFMNGDYKARVMLAHLHARQGDAHARKGEDEAARDAYQSALAHAMLALRANPRDVRLHPIVEALLSAVTPRGQDLNRAFEARLSAIEEAHRQHAEGIALARQGRPAEARTRLDTAIAMFLPVGEFHADRGRLRAREGDVEGAIADLETALRFPPCGQEAFKDLAGLYRKKEDLEALRRLGEKFKESFPHLFYPRDWAL